MNGPTVSFITNKNKVIDIQILPQDKEIRPHSFHWLIQNPQTHISRWIDKPSPRWTRTTTATYKAMHISHHITFWFANTRRTIPLLEGVALSSPEILMATVTTQASAAVFRPCASKSRFLTGSSGKLNREVAFKPMTTSSSSSCFRVEAKKGEWLPGLASPTYLNGR